MDIAQLEILAQEISACTLCDRRKINVVHVQPMERGWGKKIFVIGIEPGNQEVAEAKAFVGPAGKRLMDWLRLAGAGNTREEILSNCYLTSLSKCHVPKQSDLPKAIKNCFPFLEKQIAIVAPSVCITLGQTPLSELFGSNASLDDVVGNSYLEHELSFTNALPKGCRIVPFPHPSPLSRWLNNTTHQTKLSAAISIVSELIQ